MRVGWKESKHTNDVDTASHDDSPLATNDVGHVAGNESTEESTSRENRSDQREVATGEGSRLASGELGIDEGIALNKADEDLRASDTVDVTGVVTEEDTTEGGESAHEVGLPGNGSLNALDISGGGQADRGGPVGDALLGVGLLHREGCC